MFNISRQKGTIYTLVVVYLLSFHLLLKQVKTDVTDFCVSQNMDIVVTNKHATYVHLHMSTMISSIHRMVSPSKQQHVQFGVQR